MRGVLMLFFALLTVLQAAAEYQVFYENGKAGIRDDTGKVIVPASFDALGWSDGSFSVVNQITGYRQKDKWGLVNLKKEFITKAEFQSITSAGGDRVVASRQINPFVVKFGCVDLTGKVTVPFNYDGIEIHGLRAIVFVKNGTKYEHGVIDLNDRTLVPMRYRDIRPIGTLRYAVQDFDKKTALFSEEGKQLSPFDIDSISSFRKGLAIVFRHTGQGLIDREGNVISEAIYQKVRITDDGAKGRTFDTWKLLSEDNKEVTVVQTDSLILDGRHYLVKFSGRMGVVDANLKEVIAPEFDSLTRFQNGYAIALKGNKFGAVNRKGTALLSFEFDALKADGEFVRAMKRVMGSEQWSVYDTFGICKTVKFYDRIDSFNGKFFPVILNGYQGAVDRYGKEILACSYDSLINFQGNVIAVKFKNLYGIVDLAEHWKLLPQQNPIEVVDDERYLERQDSITFLKNTAGSVIYFSNHTLRPAHGFIEELRGESPRRISYDGLEIVVDKPGTAAPVVLSGTQEVFEESDGMRGIKRDGLYGFVDNKGRLRIANRYERIGKFQEGLAPVMILGRWGYVNKHDRIHINPNFDIAGDFQKGIAIVARQGKFGLVNNEGKLLIPMRYDSLFKVGNHLIVVDQHKRGISALDGKMLIEPRFDELVLLANELVIVRDGDKWGVLTIDGMPVIPLIYSTMQYNPATKQFMVNQKGDWQSLVLK